MVKGCVVGAKKRVLTLRKVQYDFESLILKLAVSDFTLSKTSSKHKKIYFSQILFINLFKSMLMSRT